MKFVCPLIVVEDLARSRHLYEDVLGLKVIADFGENLSFEGPFAIHLKSHFSELIDGKKIIKGSNSSEIYFEHDELEILAEKLRAEGLEFVHEIREQPWRQKVMRVYDYDKNMLEIGESMEHTAFRLAEEGMIYKEIAATLYLSTEQVLKAIKKYKDNA